MKTITVYTPTYNRAFCIHQVYESLLSQTVQDFEWLIIDDGSTDDTEAIVSKWIAAKTMDIKYVKQVNKGMLGAHNTGHGLLSTELAVCIDSDDFLPIDGIEKILNLWSDYTNDESIAGLVGLDCYKDGKIIGDSFESNKVRIKYKGVSKIKGDKKYVYRTKVLKECGPYPEVEDEKFPAQGYLYRLIDFKYDLVAVNEVFCVVEYLPDGNSFNKLKSYFNNPNGFAIHRLLVMKTSDRFSEKFRNAIHYVSSCIIAKKKKDIFTNDCRNTTILALPFGIALYFYLRNKKSGSVNKQLNK
jgi:glycosyltransferase involved in cell wall biosynthesis